MGGIEQGGADNQTSSKETTLQDVEELLQKVAGTDYDKLVIDKTDPANVTITKKLGETVISTTTIEIV